MAEKEAEIIKQMKAVVQALPEDQLYRSFPGIGEQTAAQLLGKLGDIKGFDNANQLNAYVGIDIWRYQPGVYLAQGHVNKCGDAIARELLLKEKRPHSKNE